MEKKVPERKVTLKEDDIIYVYDKRINKCIREDCDGVVKYGLVLRTSVTEEETLNCFACNKCHMKYTAYPNYVRISNPKLLHIYNQDEVTARDQKRAEDARKQAMRERRKNNMSKKPFGRKPYYKKTDENGTGDSTQSRRPYEGRKRYEDHKPYGERKPYGDKKPYSSRRPYEERTPYGERRSYGEHKPYGERKPYGSSTGYEKRKPYGEKRTFDNKRSYENRRPGHKD